METVSHKGRVVAADTEKVTVEIVSESACAACHAKGLCSLGEQKVKTVEVPASGWNPMNVGDEVEVLLKSSMGHKAVWVAYMIPLLVLVLTIFVCGAAGLGELACGLAAIGAVALYYFVIWLLRDRLRNEYIFTIKK